MARDSSTQDEQTVSFHHFAHMTKQDSDLLVSNVPRAYEDAAQTIVQLLKSLEHTPRYSLPVDQLQHALQTATRAVRDNGSDEQVLLCLCHDIGKAISVLNHPAIGAEIMRPYVAKETYQIILTHADFQGRYSYPHRGQDERAYLRYQGEPWFELALRFSDSWDCPSFDPAYPSLPLEEFVPLIKQACAVRRWGQKAIHSEPTK